jgi:hypothetical protein
MKLVLRILPTVFLLISSTAFADTTRSDMFVHGGGIGPYNGVNFNVRVQLVGGEPFSPRFNEIDAFGHTPTGWFGPDLYLPGESVLGPTTVSWDAPLSLTIGSNFYNSTSFDVFPTAVDVPFITLPATGNDFEVFHITVPKFVWELDGTIPTNCPSSGCNFEFRGFPGTLRFEFTFSHGFWYASGGAFNVPEPGTLALLVIGIGAVGWRKFRSASRARGR